MTVLISGGCKNGKTMYAQKMARKMAEDLKVKLYYLATMIPKDMEDLDKIENHKRERMGWGFITIEEGKDILKTLNKIDKDAIVLFDSLTAILENTMFKEDFSIDEEGFLKLENDIRLFIKERKNTIFVTDNVFCDGNIFDEVTEEYRKYLARLDKIVAQKSDTVIEIVYGNEVMHKNVEN